MPNTDRLAAIERDVKKTCDEQNRSSKWEAAQLKLYQCKEAIPLGDSAAVWSERIFKWLAAAKEFEHLADHKPPNLIGSQPSNSPYRRIQIIAKRFEESTDDCKSVAGDIVITALRGQQADLISLMKKVLLCSQIDMIRVQLRSLAEITYFDMSDWPIDQGFQSLNQYFLFLNTLGKKAAEILDLWQGKPASERKAICPTEYDLIITNQTDVNGNPSRQHMIEIIKQRIKRAKSKMISE
jgi:hypothetical protein